MPPPPRVYGHQTHLTSCEVSQDSNSAHNHPLDSQDRTSITAEMGQTAEHHLCHHLETGPQISTITCNAWNANCDIHSLRFLTLRTTHRLRLSKARSLRHLGQRLRAAIQAMVPLEHIKCTHSSNTRTFVTGNLLMNLVAKHSTARTRPRQILRTRQDHHPPRRAVIVPSSPAGVSCPGTLLVASVLRVLAVLQEGSLAWVVRRTDDR